MILEQNLKILVIVYSEKRNRQLALKLPFNFDLVNLELPIVKEKSFVPEEKGGACRSGGPSSRVSVLD